MKEKLNVIFFIDNFSPAIDGVVRTVENYASILSKENRVSVVAPKYYKYKDNFEYEVMRTIAISKSKKNFAVALHSKNTKVARKIKSQKAQIYHAHSPFTVGHFALKEAKKNKVPIIATFHSKYKDDIYQVTHSKLITYFIMKYIIRFYNRCDYVWACSNATANTLREYGYKKQIMVMENGTDFVFPNNYEELVSKVRKKYKIEESNKNLLFVGQINWKKNIKLIIDTFKKLQEDDKSYHLYFVGSGSNESAIKEYVISNGLSKSVKFLGSIKDKEVLKGVYIASDLLFFPSIYDNAPLVLREASAMKIPSLLAKGSSAAEVVEDEVNGYVALEDVKSMEEKIIKIFSDKGKMLEVGLKASKTIPESWENVLDRVKNEYFKIIEDYNKKKE